MRKWMTGLLFLLSFSVLAQENTKLDSSLLVALNQKIDDYVIARNTHALEELYAPTFSMTHGDGRRDNKASWLAAVGKSSYIRRQHDSVHIEFHDQIAILKGSMVVQKPGTDKSSSSSRKYIRVFARRDQFWQLLSHITLYQQ